MYTASHPLSRLRYRYSSHHALLRLRKCGDDEAAFLPDLREVYNEQQSGVCLVVAAIDERSDATIRCLILLRSPA